MMLSFGKRLKLRGCFARNTTGGGCKRGGAPYLSIRQAFTKHSQRNTCDVWTQILLSIGHVKYWGFATQSIEPIRNLPTFLLLRRKAELWDRTIVVTIVTIYLGSLLWHPKIVKEQPNTLMPSIERRPVLSFCVCSVAKGTSTQ